jgi:hypothetical protein
VKPERWMTGVEFEQFQGLSVLAMNLGESSATWGYDSRLPVNHHFSEIALNALIFLRLFVSQLKISLDFFSV